MDDKTVPKTPKSDHQKLFEQTVKTMATTPKYTVSTNANQPKDAARKPKTD